MIRIDGSIPHVKLMLTAYYYRNLGSISNELGQEIMINFSTLNVFNTVYGIRINRFRPSKESYLPIFAKDISKHPIFRKRDTK